MKKVKIGNKVDNFELESTNKDGFEFKDYKGKKLVIYFYPKDNTSGCTQESIDFSSKRNLFRKLNCEIFGVSRDSIKSHENFKLKQSFPFELLSDHPFFISNPKNARKMAEFRIFSLKKFQ